MPRGKRRRIAFLSPLPPARTGIATYSEAVLRGLRARRFPHELVSPWPLPPRVDELVGGAALPVYHLGNNVEFHGEIYRLAVRRPGLVVLHDLALDDLARAFLNAGDPLGTRTEAEADAARERLLEARPEVHGPLEVPWCAYVVRRARGVVVHSKFGRRYLDALGTRTPVYVVPHPVIDPLRAARKAGRRAEAIRERLGEQVIVGVLGDVGEAKALDAVLQATAMIDPPVHLAIVGRRIPGYDVEAAMGEYGNADRVTVATDVTEADFYAWLQASDVVVNLRYPHRGEVSGTLIRALAAGKPVVVQATGTYLDWPGDAVIRIPGGRPDPQELAEALRRLAGDPKLRQDIGARAREHMDRLRRSEATAAGYAHAIEETLRLTVDPARRAVARWAEALAALGAGEPDGRLATGYVDAVSEMDSVETGVSWSGGSGLQG
ncbi:MAG: glycosyltransferase family 4 protein [Actinomycetota bacterium]